MQCFFYYEVNIENYAVPNPTRAISKHKTTYKLQTYIPLTKWNCML